MKGLLCTAEEQKSELAEHLKNANANVEQYRAMVLTLEENLKKEKEVQFCFVFFRNSATCCIPDRLKEKEAWRGGDFFSFPFSLVACGLINMLLITFMFLNTSLL